MPRRSKPIRIAMKEEDAIRLFAKVKPTKDMPRPGAAKKPTKQSSQKDRGKA